MDIQIRNLFVSESWFLEEMLFEALFVPPGYPPFDRSILENKELSKYFEHWSKHGDLGVVAIESNRLIGAAWCRLFTSGNPGYGFVSADIPELSMAVIPEFRGKGIGSELLKKLLDRVKMEFSGISLSVDKSNPAKKLYERFGFKVVKAEGNPTMLLMFN